MIMLEFPVFDYLLYSIYVNAIIVDDKSYLYMCVNNVVIT